MRKFVFVAAAVAAVFLCTSNAEAQSRSGAGGRGSTGDAFRRGFGFELGRGVAGRLIGGGFGSGGLYNPIPFRSGFYAPAFRTQPLFLPIRSDFYDELEIQRALQRRRLLRLRSSLDVLPALTESTSTVVETITTTVPSVETRRTIIIER